MWVYPHLTKGNIVIGTSQGRNVWSYVSGIVLRALELTGDGQILIGKELWSKGVYKTVKAPGNGAKFNPQELFF